MFIAKKTPTTQMPEMVAALNGFGGFSSALVAMAFMLIDVTLKDPTKTLWHTGAVNAISTPLTILIGMVTLTGSFVAYLKLSGKKVAHPLKGSNRHMLHASMGVVAVLLELACEFDGVFDGEFGARPNGEMRGVHRVAHQHHVAAVGVLQRPLLAGHTLEVEPG